MEQCYVRAMNFSHAQGKFRHPSRIVVQGSGKHDPHMSPDRGFPWYYFRSRRKYRDIHVVKEGFGDRPKNMAMEFRFSMGACDQAICFPFTGEFYYFRDCVARDQVRRASDPGSLRFSDRFFQLRFRRFPRPRRIAIYHQNGIDERSIRIRQYMHNPQFCFVSQCLLLCDRKREP